MLPIVSQLPLQANQLDRRLVVEYAQRLLAQPNFKSDAELAELAVVNLGVAPTLHIDDFTDVALFAVSSTCQEQRARLRATDGDLMVTKSPVDSDLQNYFELSLGLGRVQWLQAEMRPDSLNLAQACWLDRSIRRQIVQAMRGGGLSYLHPYMGNRDVWQLAKLVSQAAHRPLHVLAPPPAVAHWVNDKVAFAQVVEDLLGGQFVPQTESAYNYAILSQRVHELAQKCRYLALKVPNASAGAGNLFLDAAPLKQMSLQELDEYLRVLFPATSWPENSPMLVDVWETNVYENASVQTWIPPLADGDPIIEGVFSQLLVGPSGQFVGCIPLQLPDHVRQEVVRGTSLLILLYQQLGYVGRCSFDFLLVGENAEQSQVEFIECNGRWGGASLPMSLVNRLFGDWKSQPFAAVSIDDALPRDACFAQIVNHLPDDIYRCPPHASANRKQGSGWLIPFNSGRIATHGDLNWIVLGADLDQVKDRVAHDLPARLSSLQFQNDTSNRSPH